MNQTIYFRKDIWDKFKDEKKKSELINNLLAKNYGEDVYSARQPAKKHKENFIGVVRGAEFVPKAPDPEFGYPCCKAQRPCKHWTFDGGASQWVNQLTGKIREVA